MRKLNSKFSEILRNSQFFKPIFCEKFEIAAVQKDANLVELEKCCRTHIFLQNFVLIQPRTSPPKICKFSKNAFSKNAFSKNADGAAPCGARVRDGDRASAEDSTAGDGSRICSRIGCSLSSCSAA